RIGRYLLGRGGNRGWRQYDRKRVVLLMLLDSVNFALTKKAVSLDSGITTI
ncbi:hypothetical protein KI387_017375, partial [Taxus chinensis]